MNEKSIKNLRRLCYVALFFILCWALFFCFKFYNEVFVSTGVHVHWDSPTIGYSATIFFLYVLLSIVSIVLCFMFIFTVLRGIKKGEIFPKAGVIITRLMAVAFFFYAFICDNLGQAFLSSHFDENGESLHELVLTDNPFIYALMALIFSQMYNIGHQLARENELTV